jgi:hypothetical protein
MSRWVKFLIAILAGLATGLIYGWGLNPVKYTDTSPDTLRADYRADYVLMTAEVYQADPNLDAAARRLAMLGSSPPAQIAAQALQFGLQAGYPVDDLQMIQNLTSALQTWQPGSGSGQ